MENEEKKYKKTGDVHEQLKQLEKKKEKEDVSEVIKRGGTNFVQTAVYYGLPLVGIGIFLGILFRGTVPAIQGILDKVDEVDKKRENLAGLDRQIESLEDLKAQESQYDSDLLIIEKIVPSAKTKVAEFVGEIDSLAQEHNLEVSQYSSGEQIEKIEEELEEELGKKDSAGVIHVPTTSEYTAEFNNIKQFLDALYYKEDFIILGYLKMQGGVAREYYASLQEAEGEEITVDTALPEVAWTMEVTFEKYQFSEGFKGYLNKNLVSLTDVPDSEALQFIRDRYGK